MLWRRTSNPEVPGSNPRLRASDERIKFSDSLRALAETHDEGWDAWRHPVI